MVDTDHIKPIHWVDCLFLSLYSLNAFCTSNGTRKIRFCMDLRAHAYRHHFMRAYSPLANQIHRIVTILNTDWLTAFGVMAVFVIVNMSRIISLSQHQMSVLVTTQYSHRTPRRPGMYTTNDGQTFRSQLVGHLLNISTWLSVRKRNPPMTEPESDPLCQILEPTTGSFPHL